MVVGAVLVTIVAAALGAPTIVLYALGVVILIALINFIARYVNWAGVNFVVTTDRLIFRSGVFAKAGIEIPLERINTVFFNATLFERMVGSGDLTIESAGEGGQQNFDNVRKPQFIQQEIYRACLLYTSPSPRDATLSRMPSSA